MGTSIDFEKLADEVITIARQAGKIILGFYKNETLDIKVKKDASPVTKADLAADRYISESLASLSFNAPIISEESGQEDAAAKFQSEFLWVVDPLDGTRGFINETDEFAVCIGLLRNKKPFMGVLFLPVLDVIYCGIAGSGSFKIEKSLDGSSSFSKKEINCLNAKKNSIAVNRNQLLPQEILAKFSVKIMSAAGKFGIIAEGEAEMYLRQGPTSEWDTAAGQCIVEASGGFVVDLNGERLTYGKKGFLNPGFVAFAPSGADWKTRLASLIKTSEQISKKPPQGAADKPHTK